MSKLKWVDAFSSEEPPIAKRHKSGQERQHSLEEWESWKPQIERLYEQHELSKVKEELQKLGFHASERQLSIRLKDWGGNAKNVKLSEEQWESLARRLLARQQEDRTKKHAVRYKDNAEVIPSSRVKRGMERRLMKQGFCDTVSVCQTISSRGLSVYTSNSHGFRIRSGLLDSRDTFNPHFVKDIVGVASYLELNPVNSTPQRRINSISVVSGVGFRMGVGRFARMVWSETEPSTTLKKNPLEISFEQAVRGKNRARKKVVRLETLPGDLKPDGEGASAGFSRRRSFIAKPINHKQTSEVLPQGPLAKPPDHKQDLEDYFGGLPVEKKTQIKRELEAARMEIAKYEAKIKGLSGGVRIKSLVTKVTLKTLREKYPTDIFHLLREPSGSITCDDCPGYIFRFDTPGSKGLEASSEGQPEEADDSEHDRVAGPAVQKFHDFGSMLERFESTHLQNEYHRGRVKLRLLGNPSQWHGRKEFVFETGLTCGHLTPPLKVALEFDQCWAPGGCRWSQFKSADEERQKRPLVQLVHDIHSLQAHEHSHDEDKHQHEVAYFDHQEEGGVGADYREAEDDGQESESGNSGSDFNRQDYGRNQADNSEILTRYLQDMHSIQRPFLEGKDSKSHRQHGEYLSAEWPTEDLAFEDAMGITIENTGPLESQFNLESNQAHSHELADDRLRTSEPAPIPWETGSDNNGFILSLFPELEMWLS